MLEKKEESGTGQSFSDSDSLIHTQICTFINKLSGHTIIIADNQGVIIRCNCGAERMFGYSLAEITGQTCDKLFPTKGNEIPFMEQFDNAKAHKSVDYEQWAYRKDGSQFWANIEIAAIADENGQENNFGLIVHDLSKRKQIEDNLRESQEKLRLILDAIPNPIFVKDKDLKYTECNLAFEKYTGLKREQIIGSTLFKLFEKSKAEVYQKADRELLLNKRTQTYESMVRFRDGSDHNVVFRKNIYPDRQGGVAGIVGLIEDITDRVRAEESLREITKIYQLILENSTIGIALIRDRVFEWANNRVGEMLILPIEKLKGASTRTIYPTDEVYQKLGEEAYPLLERGGRYDINLQLVRSDGTLFWCRFIGKAINPQDLHEGTIWMFEDITDRVSDEENLRRITKMYQLILDNSTLGIALVRNRICEWANNRLGEMLQVPIEKLKGVSTRIIYPSDEPYELRGKEAYPLLKEGSRYDATLQLKRSDGTLFWCRFIGKAINPENSEEGSIWMLEDITDRIRDEENLREITKVYQLILESSTFGISFVRNRVFEWANNRLGEMLLLPIENIQGASTRSIYPSDEPYEQLGKEAYPLLAKGGRYDTTIQLRRSDGTLFWCRFVGKAINPGNIDEGSIWIFEDITDRINMQEEQKLAEEALRKSQSQLSLAMELSLMNIWEYDVQASLFQFDDQFYSIYDASAGEQAGYLTLDEYTQRFVHPEERHIIPLEISKALASTLPYYSNQVEHRIVRADGEIRHVIVRFTAIKDKAGHTTKLLGAIQDVTERKKIEIQLNELIASKDKFFSIIAHDLKNPFNSLIGFSELLMERVAANDYSRLDFFAESLHTVSTQTYSLLENLLEWANSQRGGIQYNPREINLQNQVTEVYELLSEMASKKNIQISVNIPDQITVIVDQNMLKTILRNLISNAIKFTFINGKIDLSATASNSEAIVTVADNGTGMSPETIQKLFKLESNLSTRGTNDEKGTGLGLMLCKEFVEKHGGTIWAESEPGTGSKFMFTLPVKTN